MTAIATGSAAADHRPEAHFQGKVVRFAGAVARLNLSGGRLGLAVSGGPDSMAMLILARAALPGGFEVASVDHALRAESVQECAMVERLCAGWSIPHSILRVEVGRGNLQAAARGARYAALAGWARERGLAAIATAHHADDQAETLLMRLNRGSGLAGLAGVRARTVVPGTGIPLLRPLLSFRRRELEQIVATEGITPVRDPSNENRRFDRVRIRRALVEGNIVDPLAAASSAAHLAEAEEALDWAAQREWAERVEVEPGLIRYSPQAPRAVALRIVERAVAELGTPPRGETASRLLDALMAGEGGNVGGILARVRRGEWVFTPEPPRR